MSPQVGWDGILIAKVFVDSFIDDLNYVRDVKVCTEGTICHIPGSICYGSED